jgi:broad specificity phosphatase PhoE
MSSERSDIERLRRTSKRLLRDARAGKPEALRKLVRTDREPQLADAQYAVAKTLGFQSWPELVATVGPGRDTHRRNVIQQHTGPGLSDLGREQANVVARRLGAGEFGAIRTVRCSRRPSTIEMATVIATALGVELEEPTCDLCDAHPGDAEGLTQEEMFDRYGPNYDFVPNAEANVDAHARLVSSLHRIAEQHGGQTPVVVTESYGIAASFAAFGGMPRGSAWEVVHGSITVWNTRADGGDHARAASGTCSGSTTRRALVREIRTKCCDPWQLSCVRSSSTATTPNGWRTSGLAPSAGRST